VTDNISKLQSAVVYRNVLCVYAVCCVNLTRVMLNSSIHVCDLCAVHLVRVSRQS